MNKTAIKNFAIWARVNLMESAKQRAYEYEITENGTNNSNADIIGGRPLSKDEKDQRRQLIEQINSKGFNQVMEEAAYTWFNRFIALRYMEVNGYLPTRIRVFTNEEGEFKPEILKEAMTVELDGLDRDKILELLDKQDNEALYKMLLIAQCNSLSEGLPYMFEKIANWTELLFPANLLKADSVIGQMVTVIPEDDWTDAVQIIGWLYQYYNSELKDETFALLKKNVKITKERIPAATQLFTPDWIVRYMVENSLGRIYIQRKLVNSGEWLVADEATKVSMEKKEAEEMGWKYYLPEAEQEPEVRKQLMQISNTYTGMKVEDIKVIDPCMGSGHILVYAFDVFMQIYTASGWSERDAAKSIIENNIYGLDIDDRAGQLAYFAVMMKARKYNRRILNGSNRPNVMAIQDSAFMTDDLIEYVAAGNKDIRASLNAIRAVFKDAKEYGSILEVKPVDTAAIYQRIEEIEASTPEDIFAMLNKEMVITRLYPMLSQSVTYSQKYDIVITNPPYMSVSNAGTKVNGYVVNNYPDSKVDMYAVFIERCSDMAKTNAYQAMITQHGWMFLGSFEKMRSKIVNKNIVNMIHLGARAFEEIGGEVVQTAAYVIQNTRDYGYRATYSRLVNFPSQDLKEKEFLLHKNEYTCVCKRYRNIPGNPIAYWLTDKFAEAFNGKLLGDIAQTKQGFATGSNDLFLRFWHEVPDIKAQLGGEKVEIAKESSKKWFPCNKGGSFRKWYGNNIYLANWEADGRDMRAFKGSVIRNPQFYFKPGITWSSLANQLSLRFSPEGFVFESKGSMCFPNDVKDIYYILGLLNSKITSDALAVLSPTLDFHEGPMAKVPVVLAEEKAEVETIVEENIEICKKDWDSYETSWDFAKHPLLSSWCRGMKIEDAFAEWSQVCQVNYEKLKKNEEKLNSIFIRAYGLESELSPSVDEADISIQKADLTETIKSLLSYAVGCMFGRYSLSKEGLVFAGGEWNNENHSTFSVDVDNIIPISDDEYFTDDIVERFISFVKTAFGTEFLEDNLKFIATCIGGKGSAREIIRNYYLNDFYKDHLKTYQKRPIYWLFDSGKKNGFKCLIYMHRYQPDTIARIRTDYIHELQSRYRTAIADLEDRVEHAAAGDKVKLNKQLAKIKDQELELRQYEEKIHHLADQMISIDLDDGVKVNYAKFGDVLAKIK